MQSVAKGQIVYDRLTVLNLDSCGATVHLFTLAYRTSSVLVKGSPKDSC